MNAGVISITFDFQGREASGLQQLNDLLSVMELRDLELKNPKGYLETTLVDGTAAYRECRLDRGTLVCKLAGNGTGHRFQIESTMAEDPTEEDPAEEESRIFVDRWRKKHPGRLPRIRIAYNFDGVHADVVVHHEA